jgi:predicted Holliday junction resolvase-like endonuclease
MDRDGARIIGLLKQGGFYAECPCCGEEVPLRKAEMFFNDEFTPKGKEIYNLKLREIAGRRKALKALRKAISLKSETTAQAVNIGYILERIAPTLPGFGFRHNDCRAIFDPIDYLVFEGLSGRGRVERIVFADIKTGAARLSRKQKQIREAINGGGVEWRTYGPGRRE